MGCFINFNSVVASATFIDEVEVLDFFNGYIYVKASKDSLIYSMPIVYSTTFDSLYCYDKYPNQFITYKPFVGERVFVIVGKNDGRGAARNVTLLGKITKKGYLFPMLSDGCTLLHDSTYIKRDKHTKEEIVKPYPKSKFIRITPSDTWSDEDRESSYRLFDASSLYQLIHFKQEGNYLFNDSIFVFRENLRSGCLKGETLTIHFKRSRYSEYQTDLLFKYLKNVISSLGISKDIFENSNLGCSAHNDYCYETDTFKLVYIYSITLETEEILMLRYIIR
jgi:hypothetical protein